MSIIQVILLFGIVAVLFDVIWATISRAKGFSYAKGAWVSFLIYFIAGGIAFQSHSILEGFLSGMGVAFCDATIGWYVSWIIGPGRMPDTISKKELPQRIISTIFVVTILGGLLGLIGALVI